MVSSNSNNQLYVSRIIVAITFFIILSGATSALSNSGGGRWAYSRDIIINNPGTEHRIAMHLFRFQTRVLPAEAQAKGAGYRKRNNF